MQQKLHKDLPRAFLKLMTDVDAAAVLHSEGVVLKILRMLQIDDHARPQMKKRESFFNGSVKVLNGWRVASVFPAVV